MAQGLTPLLPLPPPPPDSPPHDPPAGGGGDGPGGPPRRSPPRGARAAFLVEVHDDAEADADADDGDFLPLDDYDYSSTGVLAGDSTGAATPRLPRAAPPSFFSRAGERGAVGHSTPIWGVSVPPACPDEYGERLPRPV